MMKIYLNDKVHQVEKTQSLQDLLAQAQHTGQHFAVAINHHLVPRSVYHTTMLNPEDRVDIIVPMQGG